MENQETQTHTNIPTVQPLEIPAHTETHIVFAPFWRRVLALLIDDALIFIFSFSVIINSLLISKTITPLSLGIFFLVYILSGIIYNTLMVSGIHQATLGKQLLNIQVTDFEGNKLTQNHALKRESAKIITRIIPFYIGWLMYFFTNNKQTLHDFIGNTVVTCIE